MMLDRMFTAVQVMELIGLVQCVLVLTLIVLKGSDLRQASPAVAFFAALGLGFGLPAAFDPRIGNGLGGILGTWLAVAWIPALSYLVILQVAIGRLPAARHLGVLALPLLVPPIALAAAGAGGCEVPATCHEFGSFVRVFGVIPGALVLLLLWLQRHVFARLWEQQDMHDRYWVVLALIVFNVLNLWVDLAHAAQVMLEGEAAFVRAVFGLTLVYLMTTLVFRIEPKPVALLPGFAPRKTVTLTPEERTLAKRIEEMMALEKLFQEPTLSRADLAREVGASQLLVARVINGAFRKSFHRFVNEYRVEEARRLLRESDLNFAEIAFDAGFDGVDSFDRVFTRLAGVSPAGYRAANFAAAGGESAGDALPDREFGGAAAPRPSGARG